VPLGSPVRAIYPSAVPDWLVGHSGRDIPLALAVYSPALTTCNQSGMWGVAGPPPGACRWRESEAVCVRQLVPGRRTGDGPTAGA